eukprot:TRINITY_DN779897_c0_g1_i1.p1 TRINITY_DN779897_c0_g1~~TRINITY_DN779897_c0_g1_i1.p1  ORF type:complete len:455 (-),score=175.47 TRINITY_DN779897_c0_g1_i1:143-1507(-)
MDDYLQSTVGKPLIEGLAELSAVQVSDPVSFLGNYLKTYEQRKVDVPKEEIVEEVESKEETKETEQPEQLEDEQQKFYASLDSIESQEELLSKILEYIQKAIGADCTYAGELIPGDEENGFVRYNYSNEEDKCMLNNFLPEGKGVSFKVLKPGEDEEEEEGSPVKVLNLPQVLHNRDVKFFKKSSLGGYLCAGFDVKSQLTIEGLEAENAEETAKDIKLLIAFDSLKSNIRFSKKSDAFVEGWVKILQHHWMRVSAAELAAEKTRREEFATAQLELAEKIVELPEDAEGAEDEAEEQKALRLATAKYEHFKSLLTHCQDQIKSIAQFKIEPEEAYVKTCYAALVITGILPKELRNPQNMPEWSLIKKYVESAEIIELCEKFDFTEKIKELIDGSTSHEAIGEIIGDVAADDLKEKCGSMFVLRNWIDQAMACRDCHIAAEIAAAEAAAAPADEE